MTRRATRALALALLTAFLTVLALGAPAHADPDRLRLSIDSETPLFSGTYAPGAVDSIPFTITNESPSRTLATIELLRLVPPGDLASALSFSATVEGASRETFIVFLVPRSGQAQGQCLVLGSAYLAPRETVDAKVTMDMVTTDNMDQEAQFAFRVTLSQVTNKGKANPCGAKSKGASTQVLGSQAKAASFMPADPQQLSKSPRSNGFVYGLAAGVLAAGGLLLVSARRRRGIV